MTREIEYRAYWKSKGEIRDVVDIYFGKKNFVQMIRVLCEHDGMSYPSDDIYVDDFILMQYTGIKDKQGVKIFEGDVVASYCGAPIKTVIALVLFKEGCFWARTPNHRLRECILAEFISVMHGTEVVGSIYENPELLEDKK